MDNLLRTPFGLYSVKILSLFLMHFALRRSYTGPWIYCRDRRYVLKDDEPPTLSSPRFFHSNATQESRSIRRGSSIPALLLTAPSRLLSLFSLSLLMDVGGRVVRMGRREGYGLRTECESVTLI